MQLCFYLPNLFGLVCIRDCVGQLLEKQRYAKKNKASAITSGHCHTIRSIINFGWRVSQHQICDCRGHAIYINRIFSTVMWHSTAQWHQFNRCDFYCPNNCVFLSSYYGDAVAGDALSYNNAWLVSNGMKFSTYDSPNDLGYNGHCASTYNGGWWFSNCACGCLTCRNAFWGTTPATSQMQTTRMMFKPLN